MPPKPALKMVPFRLSAEDRSQIQDIRDHYGLPSEAAAVRYAVQRQWEQITPKPRKPGVRQASRD